MTAPPLRNQRVFADIYTNLSQERWSEAGFPGWRRDYLAFLRLDVLLAKTVVVTDTDLFDGRFFLARDLEALHADLGGDARGAALEIRGRGKDLEDSLLALMKGERDRVAGFAFSCIRDVEARLVLAKALEAAPFSRVEAEVGRRGVVGGISGFLREELRRLGFADLDDVHFMEEGWTNVLAHRRRAEVEFRPWSTWDFKLAEKLAADRFDHSTLTTSEGRALQETVAEAVARGRTRRGEVLARLVPALESSSPLMRADASKIFDWYELGRQRAIADQHAAVLSRVVDEHGGTVGPEPNRLIEAATEAPGDGRGIEAPVWLLNGLGEMSAPDFTDLCWRHADDIRRWQDAGERDALASVLGSVAAASPPTRPARLWELLQTFVIPALGAGASEAVSDRVVPGAAPPGAAAGAGMFAGRLVTFLWSKAWSSRRDRHRIQRVVEYAQARLEDSPPHDPE